MLKVFRLVMLVVALFGAKNVFATTYYVDYASGLNTNNGTSKSAPWKTAPGMCNAGANCSNPAATINPGDRVLFKGCVTWPNAAFSWHIPTAGTSGNHIVYGVDKNWWDSSGAGCSSAWNRPILHIRAKTFSHPRGTGSNWVHTMCGAK